MNGRLRLRRALAAGIVILAGSLAIMILQNFRADRPEEMLQGLPPNIDLSLQRIDYTETRDGRKSWRLTADSAAHSVREGIARIENIRMVFFDAAGGEELVLTARAGTLNVDSREVELSGEVRLLGIQGKEMATEVLRYREKDRTISTTAPVRLAFAATAVTARGMRYYLPSRSLVLLADVKARIEPGGGPGKSEG